MKRFKHKNQGPTQRQLRVGEIIRHCLSTLMIRGDLHGCDVDGRCVSILEVRMSPDLKIATVYIMPLGSQDEDLAKNLAEKLNKHDKMFRHEVAQNVDLKYIPQIRFRHDTSFAYSSRIDALLNSEKVSQDIQKTHNPDA